MRLRVGEVSIRAAGGTTRRSADAQHARAQYSPLIARFTDSVPPEVNTTSIGSQPREAATCSRASSSIRFAFWPWLWIDEGLPTRSSASMYAARASGSMGVVAA